MAVDLNDCLFVITGMELDQRQIYAKFKVKICSKQKNNIKIKQDLDLPSIGFLSA